MYEKSQLPSSTEGRISPPTQDAVLLFIFYFLTLFLLYFTLQYCIGFAIHWHESTTGVYKLPILNPPPTSLPQHLSGSSPCTSPKHAAPCIRHRLAIQFLHDSIHVRMPVSQIIPPSPSSSESKDPFYTSVSLLMSRIQGHHYHLSKFCIYVSVYCIGIFLSGLLHSIISSSFIHLIRTNSNVFFLMAE